MSRAGVVNKVADYYRNYVNSANIKLVNFDGAEHAFVSSVAPTYSL